MNLQDYIQLFEDLDTGGIYDYLLEKGAEYTSEVERASENFVYGCQSNAWIEGKDTPVGWEFYVDSDSYFVKGVGAVICDCLSGLTTEELQEVKWQDFVPLTKFISQEKGKGMQAIINKCKRLSTQPTRTI